MTKKYKYFLSAVFTVLIMAVSAVFPVSAETLAEDREHNVSITLPDGYVLLNLETSEDNTELIESLGYSVSSFKDYLKASGTNSAKTLFLGYQPQNKSQISVKCWTTDFSKKIGDLSFLEDDSLSKTAKELVKTKGASYKSVQVNGMKLLEIRTDNKDSGGSFGSVQYLTVRNENFYSVNFTFAGQLNDANVNTAWNTLSSFNIESNIKSSVWDVNSVLIMVVLSAAILAGVVLTVVIIYSLIRDIKKNRNDANTSGDYIERRK